MGLSVGDFDWEEPWKSYESMVEFRLGERKPVQSMDETVKSSFIDHNAYQDFFWEEMWRPQESMAETVKSSFIDHNAYQVNDFDCTSEEAKLKFPPSFCLSKGESAEVSQQLRDDSYRWVDDHYLGSGMGLWGFADDTGGLSSRTNKFTAHKHKTEFNIPQLHNYQNVEPHWATILLQEQVAVENIEKDNSNIHVLDKTCIEETSKEGKSLEKGLSYDILSAHFGTPLNDAAKFFNVSRTTFKRICRGHGIKRWQSKKKLHGQSSSKLRRVNDEELSRTNSYCSGIPPLQAADVITVKATYNGVAIIFEVLDSSGMVDLEDNVIERLKMERDTFSIKYQDDEGDWVLIACDNDLRKCLKTSRLLKKTTVKMLIDRPINHYAS